MQIHELNTLDRLPTSTDYLAIDTGFDTAKIAADNFFADPDTVDQAISDWLDNHPEATTTVADGSLTEQKFTNNLKLKTINNYVTPQMYGAAGDGASDDTTAFISAINNADYIFIPPGDYYIGSNIALSSMAGKRIQGIPGKSRLLFDDGTTDTIIDGYNFMFSLIECSDFEIDGIVFDYVPNGSNSYNNVIVNVDCSQRIAFSNCDFYSDKDNGGLHHNCTCAWVRKTDTTVGNNSKISFDGCTFINHSGANEGGCLWIVSPMDNVVMNKCHVSHCTADEAVVAWSTDGGVFDITDSYLELVKLNRTASQLIGAWVGGIVSVKGCNLVSGAENGANSFIRAHDNGFIMIDDSFVKCDAVSDLFVFKTQAEQSIIQISNSVVEAIASTITDNQRLYEGMGTNGIFKATNCVFRLGRSVSGASNPFTVMASQGGNISLHGCSFILINPENFKELSFYFSGATATVSWTAIGNDFVGNSGRVGLGGAANMAIASAGNNRNANITFSGSAPTAFA